jgi:hypothetical protein
MSHPVLPEKRQGISHVLPLCLALGLLALSPCGADAQAERDGVADALAGHRAEMEQLTNPDPMRRPLFFDPVDVESAPQGVPCDHVVRRRPDAGAGTGFVVLMETDETPPRRLRYWQPPGDATLEQALSGARHFAMGHIKTPEIRILGRRSFVWCR